MPPQKKKEKCYHAVSFQTESVDAPIQGYGSTEAGGISLMIDREECTRIGSAGRVSENVEVKIVDHITGKPLSVGQRGELFVRGPTVMTGNQRRITAAVHINFRFSLGFCTCIQICPCFSAQRLQDMLATTKRTLALSILKAGLRLGTFATSIRTGSCSWWIG